MSTLYWIAAGFMVFGVLSTIAMVDKPREPISGAAAVIIVIINAGIIFLMVNAAQNL